VFPSIKDNEHDLRGTVQGAYYRILGAEMRRLAEFAKELKNINFKNALVEFLLMDWTKNELAPFIGNKKIYINYISCTKFEVIEDRVVSTQLGSLSCSAHEEADTKIIFHATKIDYEANVVVRCSDTDVAVILLGNMQYINSNVKLWMKVGTGNKERYIYISKLYEDFGTDFCTALPALHAMTGCDFNPAFFKKGKKKCMIC